MFSARGVVTAWGGPLDYLDGDCGVLVAVVLDDPDRTYAAVNVGCLFVRDAFVPAVPASPQTLAPDEKVERWRRLWVRDVRMMD